MEPLFPFKARYTDYEDVIDINVHGAVYDCGEFELKCTIDNYIKGSSWYHEFLTGKEIELCGYYDEDGIGITFPTPPMTVDEGNFQV